MTTIQIIIVTTASYLLGSIPFGLVVTKMAGLGDIRKIGSGNIGATNVLRTGNKGLALLTVLLDGGKGAVAVFLASKYYYAQSDIVFDQSIQDAVYLAGFTVFIGHLFPIWLKFKGGKGVATAVGIITALAWPLGVGVMSTWILVALITRYSSLAALISLVLAPIAALCFGYTHGAGLGFVLFAFIVWKHKDNIKRLLAGTESKIGKG